MFFNNRSEWPNLTWQFEQRYYTRQCSDISNVWRISNENLLHVYYSDLLVIMLVKDFENWSAYGRDVYPPRGHGAPQDGRMGSPNFWL